jgi:S1-C subfamily serine protease
MGHRARTIAVGTRIPSSLLATLALVDWVDLLIIVLMLLAAVQGLRLGAVVQILTYGGFWLGLLIGTLVWVHALSFIHRTNERAVITVGAVFLTAVALSVLGRVVGSYSNLTLRRLHLGRVDAALGVGVAVIAVLLSCWLVASVISSPNSRFTWLSSAVARSDILHSVDRVLPVVPPVFTDLQNYLNEQGFPQVFSTLIPPTTGSVATPNEAATQTLAASAILSTVKILGVACGDEQEGSGFVVGHGLVVTNAHVVAGEPATQVVVGGSSYPATVVLFDPDFDLAVLRTAAPLGPALSIDPNQVPRGTQAAILGYPEDGPLTIGSAGVSAEITALGRDIYNQGAVTRGVYALQANVRPGNSGGPVIIAGGEVVGVVFSRSTVYPDMGYALTSAGVLARVDVAESHQVPVSTQKCTTG